MYGTGKTYLARDLLISPHKAGESYISEMGTFAAEIKSHCYNIYQKLYNSAGLDYLDVDEFYQKRKDEKFLNKDRSVRDFICSYSDMIKDYFGKDIWASALLSSITYKHLLNERCYEDGVTNVVVDDWRTYDESNYLESVENVNVIKVYLSREGYVKKPSDGSIAYENIIKKEDCDIVFMLKEDYSNYEELKDLIKEKLKEYV